ncbi:MAG: hypothetical protein ABH983_03040 [Candidatus Micrarchaeota archaeon]
MFWQKKPIFKDIPAKSPELPRTKKIAFFAPHTSEHPAVMPLIAKLSKRMNAKGIQTTTHSVEDMRDAVLSVSAKLMPLKFSKDEKATLEVLFRMRDTICRLEILNMILGETQDTNIIEVHALPHDYLGNEEFQWVDYFYRIPGTRVLFPRDRIGEYATPLKKGMEALDNDSEENVDRAIELLGLIGRERSGLEELLQFLEQNISRTLLIEVPAPSTHQVEQKMHTSFESNYTTRISGANNLRTYEMDDLVMAIS